ncbi:hypothetical protein GCM10025859_58210 [Alicyclobacillus fastidiosus]|nr:hypothetical protein GCM10025859_58210 [Alicyclobacillus fastidiosus]
MLMPIAVRAGLPVIGVAMAMNLFGHGIALSGDFVIQGAPKLTSSAAGVTVGQIIHASIPLVITTGVIATVFAFLKLRRDIAKGFSRRPKRWSSKRPSWRRLLQKLQLYSSHSRLSAPS